VTAQIPTTGVGDPLVGHLVNERYHITARLARGGMATVYAAVDTRLTRPVALKVMHIGLGDDAEFARKFDREARSAARLSHPHVVSVFDQGTDGGRPYIVMEYVEGYTLRDVINAEAPVPPLRALELIEPVLGALACAHDGGLVHRDIKPENVLISERGQLKVADFGLAKAITSQTSTATQGLLIGTVSYLPPELVVSGRADARSDVYSAGVVLFELLTGRKPHTGETPIQVAYAHVHADVPPPSAFPTAGPIPPYLDALVARGTARDATLRPHDAKVFLAQARRVEAALRQGLPDDPELTADLRPQPPPPRSPISPRAWAPPEETRYRGPRQSSDPADHEVTQLVPPASAATWAPVAPGSAPGSPASASAASAAPTVRHAAPTGPPQARARQLSARRLTAQREREARRRRRGWLIMLLVLMLTAMALLAGWYVADGRFTSAPALTSLPQSEAEALAEREGLRLELSSAHSETAAPGTVISTEPAPGSKILDGGTMSAVISSGPERFAMPRVTGLRYGAARTALRSVNLKIGDVTEKYTDESDKGLVIASSATPGELLKRGSAVDLTVSRGPRPIKIRDYRGEPAAAAEAALSRAGFEVEVASVHSSKVPAGRVIDQSPSQGTGVKGDKVELTRSKGPVLVEVPAVRGKTVAAATELLKDAGFTVVVRPVAINYIGAGFVVSTRPGPGTNAPKGSTVTLYVI
jgi:eukaryotic-like serine/threonine-protein kinase